MKEPRLPGVWPGKTGFSVVDDTGFEPVTSSVSRKRATAAPIVRGYSVYIRVVLRGGYGI